MLYGKVPGIYDYEGSVGILWTLFIALISLMVYHVTIMHVS